jgi:hypothetical protein
MGYYAEVGVGRPKDLVEARTWYEKVFFLPHFPHIFSPFPPRPATTETQMPSLVSKPSPPRHPCLSRAKSTTPSPKPNSSGNVPKLNSDQRHNHSVHPGRDVLSLPCTNNSSWARRGGKTTVGRSLKLLEKTRRWSLPCRNWHS